MVRGPGAAGGEVIRVGHPLLDAYVELVTARARWNTVLATAFDLKVFFSIVYKDPVEVTTADVIEFSRCSAHRVWLLGWCGSRTARPGCRL